MRKRWKDMRKRWKIISVVAVVLLAVGVMGARYEELTVTNIIIGGTVTGTGMITATNIANPTKYLELPLMSFVIRNGLLPTGIETLAYNSCPSLLVDDLQVGVVYRDADTSPLERTFVVPNDYVRYSSPYFQLLCTTDGAGSGLNPPSVDFEMYVNRALTPIDTAAVGQTAVELNGNYSSSPQTVTLTPSGDNDVSWMQAGDRVTFRTWRDNTDSSTETVEYKGDVLFVYEATQ